MLIPFLALMRKDLRIFLADRRAVLMTVVAPIAIASFFGYIFGGGAGNQNNSPIAVLVSDQDGSAFSRAICQPAGVRRSLCRSSPTLRNLLARPCARAKRPLRS